MQNPTVPNKVIDPDTGSELWFMADRKLCDSQVLLLLRIYLRMGKKFPGSGQIVKVKTRDLGLVAPPAVAHSIPVGAQITAI